MAEGPDAPARAFIPGLELCGRYFRAVVEPIIARAFPQLRYAAALIGYGSEIQGFDDPTSTDHNWGPRLLLFLGGADLERLAEPLRAQLEAEVPPDFLGWPTRMSLEDRNAEDADGHGRRPARLRIEVHALRDWLLDWLCIEADRPPHWREWLGLSEQDLIEVTAGAVYRDDLGELTSLRARLAYFPQDVWLYKLACQWERIGQEQAFVGRCGDRGDDLGSRVIAARLVRDLMRLAFLVERRYAPYPKWFGAAFARLPVAAQIGPLLTAALQADERRGRERNLAEAARRLAERHRELGHPGDVRPQLSTFTELVRAPGKRGNGVAPERDFTVINAEAIAEALRGQIQDPQIAGLAPVGGVDQFSDSTDLLEWPRLTHAAAAAALVSREERKRPPRA